MANAPTPPRPSERHEALNNLIVLEQELESLKAEIDSLPDGDARLDSLADQLLHRVRERYRLLAIITGLSFPIKVAIYPA